MKTLLLLLLLASGPLMAQNLAALDAKNGFRDLKFGTPLTALAGVMTFQNIVKTESTLPLRAYSRESDRLEVGKARVSEIVYRFGDDVLSSVVIAAEGHDNGQLLVNELKRLYGPATGETKKGADRTMYWDGKEVHLTYSERALDKEGKDVIIFVHMFNKRMHKPHFMRSKADDDQAGW
jgi:hypothetical protein